jgi:ParB/RepB/Spo0J family partition protein
MRDGAGSEAPSFINRNTTTKLLLKGSFYMPTAAVNEQVLLLLPIASIKPSTTNPRKHFDEAKLAELAASIAESGLKSPLLVRPIFDGLNGEHLHYELVAGARRLRAVAKLGWVEVDCLSREMTDEEARETQIVENLQRLDVQPLEEAEAFDELRNRLGSIAAVSAKVGKEQSYIAKCLRLLSLTLHSRDAMRGRLIAIDHALLLARLAEAEQNAALKWTLDRNAGSKTTVEKVVADRLARRKREDEERQESGSRHMYVWEPESVVKLKGHIESGSGVALSRAPWSLTDEDYLLPDVGPCAECPKNTKANAPLFGDLDIDDPTCTDGACFQAKTAGFVQIALRAAGQDESVKPKKLVPRLSWKASSVKPSICDRDLDQPGAAAETANPAKVLKQGQWVEAKKGSCTNVRPGVTADWSDAGERGYMGSGRKLRKPGETLLVCIAVGCKVHRKDWEKPKSSNGNQAERHDPVAEQKKQEEQAFVEKLEGRLRAKVFRAILGKLDAALALRIVADGMFNASAYRKQLLDALPGISGEQLEAFTILSSRFHRELEPNVYWMMQPGGVASDRKNLWGLAKTAGVDANAVVAKHFHDEGSIAPAADRLYPKGVAWPKGAKASVAKPAAKKAAAKKPAKKAVKPAPKKSVKKVLKKAVKK